MHIVTLATCHNRKEKTLESLASIYAQELPESFTIEHVLVDDGSDDGTYEAVRDRFPDVQLIRGTGGLFWAGGMRHGWETSVSRKRFKYLFVYNDDIKLHGDSLSSMVIFGMDYERQTNENKYTIVGAFKSELTGAHTHGGRNKIGRTYCYSLGVERPSTNVCASVDTMNMNGCLLTKELINEVGFLASYFKHGGADFEYGLRVTSRGYKNLYFPSYVGFCEANSHQGTSREIGLSLSEKLKRVIGVKEYPLKQQFIYSVMRGRLSMPCFFLRPYITLVLDHFRDKKFRNKRNVH